MKRFRVGDRLAEGSHAGGGARRVAGGVDDQGPREVRQAEQGRRGNSMARHGDIVGSRPRVGRSIQGCLTVLDFDDEEMDGRRRAGSRRGIDDGAAVDRVIGIVGNGRDGQWFGEW